MQARSEGHESEKSDNSPSDRDLKLGRFAGAPSRTIAGRSLLTFFGNEINTMTSSSDQALFVEALLKEGFDLHLVVLVVARLFSDMTRN